MDCITFAWWFVKAWLALLGVAVLVTCCALYRAWRIGHDD